MNPLLNPIYSDWQTGETYGSFRIERLLSDSVLGNFYEASHVDSGASCILFLVPAGLSKLHKKLAERLIETKRKLEKADRSNILELEAIQRIHGRIVLLYKHQHVESLTSYVLNNPRSGNNYGLDQQKTREFLLQLGGAVRSARSVGIGHFFMTPDFVFVTHGSQKIKLGGCGVFEQLNYRHFETYISSAIHPIGDRDFEKVRFAAIEILSPEMRNLKRVHARSDFYCLGMCAYFMLMGYKPVRNWTLPSAARHDINSGWDLFISHCLEYNPDKRFPHAGNFIKDLEGLEELHSQPKREGRRIMRTLSKIPLPQRFERQFSPLALLNLRLGLLGLAGFFAIFSAFVFTEIIFSDFPDSEIASAGPQRMLISENANLIIQLPVEHIRVQVSGRSSGAFLVTDGQLYLRVAPGNYSLSLSSPFLQDKRVSLTVTRDPMIKSIQMQPGYSRLRIEQGAPIAELWVGTQSDKLLFVDYFDNNGILDITERLYPGQYYFQMRSPQYEDYTWEAQNLSLDEVLELKAVTNPLPAKLTISGNPDVKVRIDGSEPKAVPVVLPKIKAKQEITLEFSAKGYQNEIKKIKLKAAGEHHIVAPELVPQLGEMDVVFLLNGKSIESAEMLDGFSLNIPGKTLIAANQLPVRLSPGIHSWEITHPQLQTQSLETMVRDKELSRIELDFQYKPGIVILDYPDLKSSNITVDGMRISPVDGRLRLDAKKTITLRWEMRDFQPREKTVYLDPGQQWVWSPVWEPLEGPEMGLSWQIPFTDIHFEWIPPGSFRMGSPLTEEMRLPNEGPQTSMEITAGFWAMRHEVTQGFYQSIVGKNPSRYRNRDFPVESINWFEAMEFARRVTEKERAAGRLPENYVYRLPTEAEWEYFARGGVEELRSFHFGNTASRVNGHFSGVYPRSHTPQALEQPVDYGTIAVGQFQPNEFGLFDIHGNVAEWTLDHYIDRLPGGRQQNLYRGEGGRGRVVRGGSWSESAHRNRLAARSAVNENIRRDSVGMRLVLAPEL